MGFYRSMAGSVHVQLTSADIPECLQLLEQEGIAAYRITTVDTVTLELTVSRSDMPQLQHLCERKGYGLKLKEKNGLFWPLRTMLARPIFTVGMMVLLFLAAVLPSRILTVETEGNGSVPSKYILERAEACGLKFWTRRRNIRNEQIKNALLEAIPQLQWVGVNTYGCRAVITVRERSAVQENQIAPSISHIVAAREGVISDCTVIRGSSNCAVGQAVRKGDVLISGYTDCGITYTAERAEGEILARTKRELCLITPATCRIQAATDRSYTRFSLLIGKKRINFCKGSGISGATCDKMYSEYVLTLPGGFQLPVTLLKETTVNSVLTDLTMDHPASMLEAYGVDYLMEQMNNGVILQRSERTEKTDGVFRLIGFYDCQENIGIEQEEKIGDFNGETDGTDRQRRSGG